jgi:hypothetical protein
MVLIERKIFSGYCLCVLVFFMVSIFTRFITQNVLIEKLRLNNGLTRLMFFDRRQAEEQPLVIDWAKQYPFQESGGNVAHGTPLSRLEHTVTGVEKKIEVYTGEVLINHVGFAETATRYEHLFGWHLHETVFDMGDGYLAEPAPKADIAGQTAALVGFRAFLDSLGIDLLYVQSPHKICRFDTVPGGIADFSNQNADERMSALEQAGIPHLDLREYIHGEHLDHHSLFYKTDHHWKAETGLWAANILAGYLNAHNGFAIDSACFDPGAFRYEVYEKWFLGSAGRKVTLAAAEPEDFTLLYPLYETAYSLQIPSHRVDTRGAFDVIYDYRQLEKKDYYLHIPYSAYLYADNPVVHIRNHKVSGGKKVLLIKDSFVNTLAPFISLGVEQVELLDLRHFTGSVKSYLEQSKPDVVIVLLFIHKPGECNVP